MDLAWIENELRTKYRFNPRLGKVFGPKGYEIGSKRPDGYFVIRIGDSTLSRARVIFWAHHGYWPNQVDHDNRIRHDDRIANLLDKDHRGNMLNRPGCGKERSLPPGVLKIASKIHPYKAQTSYRGVPQYLGVYSTMEEASKAIDQFWKGK